MWSYSNYCEIVIHIQQLVTYSGKDSNKGNSQHYRQILFGQDLTFSKSLSPWLATVSRVIIVAELMIYRDPQDIRGHTSLTTEVSTRDPCCLTL
jgi:hypothetical protein